MAHEASSPKEKKKVHAQSSILGKGFDLDEDMPVTEQLAAALRASSARVLDLFREWDANGDGEVSREEFHKAVAALGLQVPKKEIDSLFNEWDKVTSSAYIHGTRTLYLPSHTAMRACSSHRAVTGRSGIRS